VSAAAPAAPAGRVEQDRRRTRRRRSIRLTLEGWAFVAPATILVLGLSVFPAVWSFFLSLQRWDGFSQPENIGIRNYTYAATDPELQAAIAHTLLYTLLFVPASVLLGLLLAVALNRRIRFIGIYRTAIFVPFVASAAATGILTTYLFSPQFGLLNNVLRRLGLPQQGWLEDQHQALVVIAIMSLWGSAAFTTVVFLAALQDIPADLLEAATLDGANRMQAFRHVTVPQLAPVILFAGIWQAIDALQLFDLVYTTTRGGPLDATQTVVYYLWKQAFQNTSFGYGSAVAWLLFVVTMLITLIVVIVSRRSRIEAF
jgi:multiple sugar transport system permease protein